jgi:3-deoxy-D-manno-octulosonic-acid transferase
VNLLDFSYLATVSLVGALTRACARSLPEAWRLRLEADVPALPAGQWIWLHAVSVGELMLAEGLVARLRDQGHRLHVSTGTPAGLDLLTKRLPGWGAGTGRVTGGAFPLDDPAGLEPFLRQPPGGFLALETELWPGLLQALEARGIPRLVVNGRLTEKSLHRGGPWLRRAASRLTLVAARDEASAEAFRHLGAPEVRLGGNLKADLPPPRPLPECWAALRAAWAACPVVVAGNTVEGEEALILSAWSIARQAQPGLRLILAPRQPRRFQQVAEDLAARGLPFRRASEAWPAAEAWGPVDILLLDTLGDLAAAYAEGSVALVAGGWAAAGGHNPLEPVRAGLPTLLGPGFANFEDLVPPLVEAGLLRIVGAEDLPGALGETMASAALRPTGVALLPATLGGALDHTMALVAPHLPALR